MSITAILLSVGAIWAAKKVYDIKKAESKPRNIREKIADIKPVRKPANKRHYYPKRNKQFNSNKSLTRGEQTFIPSKNYLKKKRNQAYHLAKRRQSKGSDKQQITILQQINIFINDKDK